MSVIIQGDQVRAISLGILVEKAAAVTADGDIELFVVSGGSVLLVGFYGDVETALPANTDLDIDFAPADGGTDVVLATTLVADSDPTGTLYTLNGTAGGILIETLDIAHNAILESPIVLTEGTIFITKGGGGSAGGSIRWYCIYVPVDDGASVAAA